MEALLWVMLLGFLVYLYLENKQRNARREAVINEERSSIVQDSQMTASTGIFYPDSQTTVVVGASEDLGAFYYRMIRLSKVIIRSKINLASISRVEFLLNDKPFALTLDSKQPTTSLRATDIANNVLSLFRAGELQKIQRAALRIIFVSESGEEKRLEITVLWAGVEKHNFQRVTLIKNAVWWVSFLDMASRHARHARHTRARMERQEEVE